MKTKYLVSSLALALGLLLLLLKLLAVPAPLRSAGGVHYVAPGAEIRVAEGTYTVVSASATLTPMAYLPLVFRPPDPCRPIPGASYSSLFVITPTNPDAENDPGFNIGLLGWELTDAYKGVVDYGMGDPKVPLFYYLFADLHTPDFSNVYRLYHGDGTLNTDWPVTVAGLAVTTDEVIHTPDSGYDIQYGYDAMVIYASRERIALNYTRGDNLLGYTIYVDGICVEPSLLALYEQLDAADRYDLPVVRGGQAIGRAWNTEIRVAVRDTGTALDPRGLDWWRRS